MSTDDAAKTERTEPKPAPPKRRGWFRRNWRWFVPMLLLAIIVAGGGALYWNFFLRVYNLQVCREAMKAIEADKGVQETLGQPITNAYWPSQETIPNARIEKDEIDVIWNIEGPKKRATAHLLAKRRQGQWDTVMLEVTPAGGKRVSIHEADNGENAPPLWQGGNPKPPKTGVKKPETKGPDININIPGLPGGGPTEKK
jgi:Cytochrome oxidase complex assembly protein 1